LVAGLTKRLGRDAVDLYPTNINYYFSRRPYPRNLGESRPTYSWISDSLSIKKKIRRFEYDLVVIGSIKDDSAKSFLSIQPYLPASIPVVLVDGGDWPEIGGDAERLGFASLFKSVMQAVTPINIFKRELLIGKHYEKNVIPFPMSFKAPDNLVKAEAKYQVSCWCVESHPIRTQALTLLEDRYDCRANGSVRGQSFRGYSRIGNSYLKELSASRIACNFRGAGWDTLRYWEIPGVATLMLSQRPQNVIPNNFQHEKQVLFCRDDLKDLTSLLDYYVRNEKERQELAVAGYQHLMRYHSYLNRTDTFLEAISACANRTISIAKESSINYQTEGEVG